MDVQDTAVLTLEDAGEEDWSYASSPHRLVGPTVEPSPAGRDRLVPDASSVGVDPTTKSPVVRVVP
jgi:hypothetical protein